MMSKPVSESRKTWRLTALLGCCALFCGILLGGVSAWFLGAVATAGLTAAAATFNFHVPAAFIRLFAIGRTAARYGERLLGHKAALADQVSHRVGLFAAMAAAPSIRKAGWQLGDEARLADYLDDVEDIEYAHLRARLPSLTIAIGLAGLLSCSAIVAPLSLLPILSMLAFGAFAGRRLAREGAAAWSQGRTYRREGAGRMGSAMASAVALKAERVWSEECEAAMNALSHADLETRAVRRLQSGFDGLASLFGPLAGACVVAAAWWAGDRGEVLLLPLALAFAWLALGETMNGASRILVAMLRKNAAAADVGRWTGDREAPMPRAASSGMPRELQCRHIRRLSPSGTPIGDDPVDLRLRAGAPTVLVGTSGTGKTSLLKQVAGWIGEDRFDTGNASLSAQERRSLSTLVLHDAAILDDTVRANLFEPEGNDAAMWHALEAAELGERIRAAGGLDAWIRQDMLSLGEAQRLNLARAFLAHTPIVLLDEPTEHLDAAQGQRILTRLAAHLSDRIVVMSTHSPLLVRNSTILELSA